MEVELLVLVTVGAAAVLVGVYRLRTRTSTPGRERPVLPSHYSSIFHTDPRYYPGHCTDCGTDNEPGYRFCEACGSQIPTSRPVSSASDVDQIFEK